MAWLIKSNPVLPLVELAVEVAAAATGTDDGTAGGADTAAVFSAASSIATDEERSGIDKTVGGSHCVLRFVPSMVD